MFYLLNNLREVPTLVTWHSIVKHTFLALLVSLYGCFVVGKSLTSCYVSGHVLFYEQSVEETFVVF